MTLSLLLDVVVCILLVAMIIYSAMLNRRLASLRSNRSDLEAVVRSFGEACARAEAGVRTLRSATDEATRLQQYLDRSQALRDDLAFLLDRGASLAERLEGGARNSRQEQPQPQARATAEDGMRSARSFARQAASFGQAGNQMAQPAEPAMAPERSMDRGGMQPDRLSRPERLERPTRERPTVRPTASNDVKLPVAEATPRSKAERELLQALRTRR